MKKFLLSSAAFTLLFITPAQAIETAADHAYMIDATTGAVLLNKAGEEEMIPSSMTKLMTAYITFSRLKEGRLKMDDMFTVSEKAWRMQGSKMFVPLGEQVSVDDLVHGMIVQSGNDACIVLAEGISGSEEAFVAEMNETAKKLGMNHTHFMNATGWPDEGHVMSARDLAVLARHIIEEFPEYYVFDSIREFTYNNIRQYNRNRLLGNDIGVDGLKTGHTDAGGYGITLSAAHDGRRLILVINGLTSDNERMREGDQLLRWGFREFTNKTLVKKDAQVGAARVYMGEAEEVPLIAANDAVVTLPAGTSEKIVYKLRYKGPVKAPVKKGDTLGELVVEREGADPQIIGLVAGADVPKLTGFAKAWAVIKHTLKLK